MQAGTQKRRSKRYHHKSSNGCLNCKRRHSKCDEQKPACTRCLVTGVNCEYQTPQTWIFPATKPLNPPILGLLEPTSAFGDSIEQRALCYYSEKLLPDVTGFTLQTEVFWRSLLPRLSQLEPAIRHILIATASKHEALRSLPPKLAELTPVCAQYHSLALRGLSQPSRPLGAEVLLMSCIAFAFFERMHAPFAMEGPCFDFVQAGLKILRERRARSDGARAQDGSSLVDEFLEPMFFQMELMLSMFVQPDRLIHLESRCVQPSLPRLPAVFADTETARRAFFHIIAARYSLVHAGAEWSATSAAFRKVRESLVHWMSAFDAYLSRNSATDSSRGFYMREQACLLVGAILYSARSQQAIDCFCRPVMVDCADAFKISIFIRIRGSVKVNLAGVNTGTPPKLKEELELWPHARCVHSEGNDALVVMELKKQ